jgi:dipeptidyl aminopeptidase/acylaminoacyl peptidase
MPLFSSGGEMSRTLDRAVRAAALLALAVMTAAAAGAKPAGGAAARRPISETDLFRFVWVADPQMSPDGGLVAFVRVSVDAKREGYESSLWIVEAAGGSPRPLTAGRHDRLPRWSPDGRRLLFLRGGDGEGMAQLYLLSMAGGEARPLTKLPQGAGAAAWSPDGGTIAFASDTSEADLARQKAKESGGAGAAPERESDVRVITRAVYRSNGAGYLDLAHPSHLWTVAVPPDGAEPAAPRQITRGELAETDPVWSRDGSRLYFSSAHVKEPSYGDAGRWLQSVPAGGGESVKLASIEGDIGQPVVSPDGRQIAFRGVQKGHPVRSYDQPDLFVVAAEAGSQPRNLTADFDYDVLSGVGGDQAPPRGSRPALPVWSADGRSLIVHAAVRGRVDLQRVDVASGRLEPLTHGDHDVVSYAASADGSRLALVLATPTAIGDLYALDVRSSGSSGSSASGRLTQLTRFNEPLFSELNLTAPEEITYRSFDGREIQAWVQKPPDFDARRKYPLILDIHGGPHGAYGFTFDHEFQWMAAKGYVVLYPNPRGSTSYGQEFGNVIQYHYPGDDFKDLMAGVDELLRRGYVDDKRLGITGGSGGGVLTNWGITQTHRFAAAVSQRSIADWSAWWYAADFTLFTPTWFRAAPWQDPADFVARSPITHVAEVTTPLMLIEGESDFRTPPGAGGEQMFRALKYLHKPVVMVRFPGESHELSRSGRPWHRVERLQHILRWFDKYLQGKKTDLYDVAGDPAAK